MAREPHDPTPTFSVLNATNSASDGQPRLYIAGCIGTVGAVLIAVRCANPCPFSKHPGVSCVLHVSGARADWWHTRMAGLLPEMPVYPWNAVPDPGAVRYAVVWKPPPGGLRRFPALRAIVSIGAGVDHVLIDPDLPLGVPILRTTGGDLTQRMREYIALHTLRLHRAEPALRAAAARGDWTQIVTPPAARRRVGVMGLGTLGSAAARTLAGLGFAVQGWARSKRALENVTVFAGDAALPAFLEASEILICLLPLTDATRGILNARLFAALPAGAGLINAGRGGHLVEADLIPALDAGHLSHAVLDVFETEPLLGDHPFWTDPRIDVTPHTASLIDPDTGARLIAENIRRMEAGAPIDDLIDPARGY